MEPNNLMDKDVVLVTIILAMALRAMIFIIGFLIVKMGYALIRDGVKGSFKFSTEAKGMKGALQSSSPGLLFVVLGIFLMCFSIFQKKGEQAFERWIDDTTGKQQVTAPLEEPPQENDNTVEYGPAEENGEPTEDTLQQ